MAIKAKEIQSVKKEIKLYLLFFTEMRVFLVMPDFPKSGIYGPNRQILLPPLGLECIGANIQDLAEVRIFDARIFKTSNFKAEIQQFQPDYVGISCNLSSQIYQVNKIAEIAKESGAITVLGGWHPTLALDETLSYPSTDIIIRSEGELTFRELIQKNDPYNVNGLSYKNNGRIIHNPPREFADLNSFPLPARNLRPRRIRRRYNFFGMPTDCLETSRGCPHRCTFCCIHTFYQKKYRSRNVSHILSELHQIGKHNQCVYIVDDNFMVNPKTVTELCDAIIREKLNMYFMTEARVDVVSKHPEVFEKMAKAGFLFLFLGLESFSDQTLQNLNKRFKFDEIKSAIKILHDLGFIIQGNIILGANLNDSEQDLLSTIEIAKSLDIDVPTFSLLTPYPGTELMKEVEAKNLLLTHDWRRFNWSNPTMKYAHLSPLQLMNYLTEAYRNVPFFTRPANRIRRIVEARKIGFFISRLFSINGFKAFFALLKMMVTMSLTKNIQYTQKDQTRTLDTNQKKVKDPES